MFASNVFHNSHLIKKCLQNQQKLLILYTFLNQMGVVKNIRRKDDRMNSLKERSSERVDYDQFLPRNGLFGSLQRFLNH